MMKRKTSRWSPLVAAAGTMLTLSALAGATVTDGVLVISVDSGSENVGDPSESFSKIRKVGGGTAVLTGESFKNFLGDIAIEQGTLGATSVSYFGKGSGKTISVWFGATLDLSSADGEKGTFSSYELDIAGTVRRGGSSANAGTLGHFSLSGGATFDTPYNLVGVGFNKTIPLNGHTLVKTGAGMWTLSGGILSNGTVRVTAGSMRLKSSGDGTQQAGFVRGDDGGLLEVSGGSTLELSPVSYERPSTADLKFSGETENTLTCAYTPPESDTHEKFNLWTGALTVGSPLLAILKNDMTFAGAVTVDGSLRTDSAAASLSTASLIFTGEGVKTFNAPLALSSGRVVFRDTDGVRFGNTVVNSAIGDSAIVFENAGIVDTGTAECPFDGVRSDASAQGQGKIPRVVVKGRTVLTSTKAVFGSSGGAAVFEIADGAVVSNGCRVGETSGEIVLVSVKTNSVWAIGASNGTSLNPQNRNGFGWTSYGDVELDGGKVIVNGGKSSLSFGQGNLGEGVLAMSGGEWVSAALNLGNKGYGLWYQTGGTAIISNKVYVGEATRPDDGARGCFTVSGEGTSALIPYKTATDSGIVGCCAKAALETIVNINNGARLNARKFWKDPASAGSAARFYVNFNGGVYVTPGPWQVFGNGGANARSTPTNPPDRVTVFSGGAVFDIAGALNSVGVPSCVDVPVPLLAPTGKGIAEIELPDAAKALAYAHRPRVYIEGDGCGATAVAEFDPDTCRLTGITVTSPGWDYTESNTHVYISTNVYMGDLTRRLANRLECAVTLADNSPDGGLVVRGDSSTPDSCLCLYGVNTYRGVTRCESGGIRFFATGGFPDGSAIDVWRGAWIQLPEAAHVGSIAGAGTVSGGNLQGVTNVIVRAEDVFAVDATPLTVTGVELAPGAKVTVEGVKRYAEDHGYASVRALAEDKLPTKQTILATTKNGVNGTARLVMAGLTDEEASCFGIRFRQDSIVLRRTGRGAVLIFR